MPHCNNCQSYFESYPELARHIVEYKDSHRQGLKWASAFLLKVHQLNRKTDFSGRIPLTEQDRENKEYSQRELSGRESIVATLCPICNHKVKQAIPIEYTHSNTAWKVNGLLVISCLDCRK